MGGRKKIRALTILKYFFYIVMSCLAIINIIFFFCYWQDLELHLSEETLMLTVVGFFFAFAGINIYSIFNTNIENEKQALIDLESNYEKRLELSEKELQFPRDLIRTYNTAQYLSSSKAFHPSSFDWIITIKNNLSEMRDFVSGFKGCGDEHKFEMYRTDLVNLSQGILLLLRDHERVVESDSFFINKSEEKENYRKRLNGLIKFVDGLRTYAYGPEDDDENKLTFWRKLKHIWEYAEQMFKNP